MRPWWVEFVLGPPGCVEANSEDQAREVAVRHGAVKSVKPLPYPANPRLGSTSNCPSFCWQPRDCAGKTSCPRPRACDD